MRKAWLYLLALTLVAGAATAIVFAVKNSQSHDDQASTNTTATAAKTPPGTLKKACEIFTLADAKQLIGDNAKGGQNPEFTPSSDLDVSTCTYTQDQGANTPITSRKTATLLVRSPKTGNGITSNQSQFGPLKPADAEHVPGYGDNAYWDAEHGQLDILKHNAWYILSNGPITPSERTLDEAKQMADLLIDKM